MDTKIRDCDSCDKRPAKYFCVTCELALCPKDNQSHPSKYPGLDHNIIPLGALKAMSFKSEEREERKQPERLRKEICASSSIDASSVILQASKPSLLKGRQEVIPSNLIVCENLAASHFRGCYCQELSGDQEEPDLSYFELTDSEQLADQEGSVALELKAAESSECKSCFNHPSINPEKRIQSKEISIHRIFTSHLDIAQTFRLQKWMLQKEEAEDFVRFISNLSERINVIGVYGSLKQSLQFIQQITKSEQELTISPEENEGILAFTNPDIQLVCLFFKVSKDDIYEKKPYSANSREAIYIRLLFDLCPVVVCCMSDSLQRNWYWSSDPRLQNPFLPRVHKGFTVNLDKRKIESSTVEEIRVISNFRENEQIYLTTDHNLFIFTTAIWKKDINKLVENINEKLSDWLQESKKLHFKSSIRSSFFSSYEYHPYFGTSKYYTFTNALKTLNESSDEIVTSIKEKYNDFKNKTADISLVNYKVFLQLLQDKYEFKSTYDTCWRSEELKFEDVKDRMQEKFVSKVDYSEENGIISDLVSLLEKWKECPECDPEEAKESLKRFFTEQCKDMKEMTETILEEEYQNLKTELCEHIKCYANLQTRNIYIVTTYLFTLNEDQLVVEATEIENKLNFSKPVEKLMFHVLEEDAAFAISESVGRYRTVKFKPSSNIAFDSEKLLSPKFELLLASGSTASFFVAFSNGLKSAYYGAAREMKGIDRGASLNVYGERVHSVTSACVLQKTPRKVFLINEIGDLFMIELVSSEKRLVPVMVDRAMPRSANSMQSTLIREPLRPKNGTRFHDIKSSDDETLYFLLTECAIEIYDLNFTLTQVIHVESPNTSYKVMMFGNYHIVVTLAERTMKAYRFQSETERVDRTVERSEQTSIPGNPVIDILYYTLFKFGTQVHFLKKKPILYIYAENDEEKCEQYFNSIFFLAQHIQFQRSMTPSTLETLGQQLSSGVCLQNVDELRWRLFTRSPLHLCSIQEGNIVPLQDGLSNFEDFIRKLSDSDDDYVTSFVSYIRLGCIEPIINSAENIKVISIIGKQSSGKSYLMNCMFGTRFDVAAHRCTDGIWISVTKIQGQTFCVLDCEGLFSVERSMQEEIKLCLLIAAISDVTILNQDKFFDRNLKYLLEKFTFGIDRLKGSKLFKGRLEVAVRDVPVNHDEGINSELEKFINNSTSKDDFLIKLFGGKFMCFSYHNFENQEVFMAAVASRRQYYVEQIPFRWRSGEKFLRILKIVMAQIYADDSSSINSREFQLELSSVAAKVRKAIEYPATVMEIVAPNNPTITFFISIAEHCSTFSMRLFDVTICLTKRYKVFDEYLERSIPGKLRMLHHNEWYKGIEDLMKSYFVEYKKVVLEILEKDIAVTDEVRAMFEEEKNTLEIIFDNTILLSHTLCLRKCKNCNLYCIQAQNHSDSCDCSTSHKCQYDCSLCQESRSMCSLQAGHEGSHVCSSIAHICGKQCDIPRCNGCCVSLPNHTNSHRCSAPIHPCNLRCALFQTCNRLCEISQDMQHELHDCGQKNCPLPCQLCKGEHDSTCSSQNHLHDLCMSPDTQRDLDTGEVIHLCSKEHPCKYECENGGVCSILITQETRVWSNEYSSFSYNYVTQKAVKKKCKINKRPGFLTHSGNHSCGEEFHGCTASCPDCGTICQQQFEHEGVHTSAAHRNMEKCIYLAKQELFQYQLKEERKKTTRKLKAGESAKPEFCDQFCMRNGRGHTHVMECRGADTCLEVTQRGFAVHSDAQYYPDLDKKYDLVECDTFWRLKGWEPPVLKKSPDAQLQFSLCPYFCASPEHPEPVYCEGNLFHSNSAAYKDHFFSGCKHKGSFNFDIVFVLDCTGSMGEAFPQVKKVITKVINQYNGPKLSNKFAIVGYTDHFPDNGAFPADYPVSIYPPSRRLRDFDLDAASRFLSSLIPDGGGGSFGEAMLDGLNAANELTWRQTSTRMCFIIGDDCPHGKIFHYGTKYADGCPCGLDWKSLLTTMKQHNAQVRFVNLSTIMNKTADLFQEHYGENFESISLESMATMSDSIFQSIAGVIEHNLEFAIE